MRALIVQMGLFVFLQHAVGVDPAVAAVRSVSHVSTGAEAADDGCKGRRDCRRVGQRDVWRE